MNQTDDNTSLPAPRPIVGWAGGKGRLIKYLLPLVPKDHTLYCEVFFGGGALFFAKTASHVEVINDIHRDLVSLYRCVKYHLNALLDELEMVPNSRRDFEDYGKQPGLTDIQRAARWLLRNKLSFGGHGKNFAIFRSHPPASRSQRLIAIQALNRRLDKAIIEERPWDQIVAAYDSPETFFFFDPPYPEDGGQIYSGWSEHELARFCLTLPKLKGRWLFTFKDCKQVRDLMAGYRIKSITRANGIGNNGKVRAGRKYREVIITSDRVVKKLKKAA